MAEDRYHRQQLISWWDQERLASARILVVGAGALGNEILKNLALLGVGSIVVIDMDDVENSNLARCVLFRDGDEGAPKAPTAAERASELNPSVSIRGVVGDIRHTLGLGTFIDADLVLAGLDGREARLAVNEACWKTSTPWIDGAIEGLMGVMRVFVPPDSADYESILSEEEQKLIADRRACSLLTREEMEAGKVPTTATSASVIAGMQVQEAIKHLHAKDLPFDFAGKGFYFNGMSHDSYVVEYTAREDSLSRDTYDLSELTPLPREATFGEMLDRAASMLGDGAYLALEHEVVRGFACGDCGEEEQVNRPVTALREGAAICPACGSERRIESLHRIERGDDELLALAADNLGLPPAEVVTATSGLDRRFFLVGAESSAFSSDA